jgi:hypothetical protein
VRGLEAADRAEAAELQWVLRVNLADRRRHLNPLKSVLPEGMPLYSLAFRPDGKTLLTGGGSERGGRARLWDLETGRPTGPAFEHRASVRAAFGPPSQTIVAVGLDGGVQLWDATTGRSRGEPLRLEGPCGVVAFSPDSRTILSGGPLDKAARLWDPATGRPHSEPLTHDDWPRAAAFGPDGRTVLTSARDAAYLWDVPTGRPLAAQLAHPGKVSAAAFSPDGRALLTISTHTAHVWHVPSGRPLGEPLAHPALLEGGTFSPDGRTVLTGSQDNAARLWPAPQPLEGDTQRVVLWLQVATGLELDDQGAVHVLDAPTWQERRRLLEELGGPP